MPWIICNSSLTAVGCVVWLRDEAIELYRGAADRLVLVTDSQINVSGRPHQFADCRCVVGLDLGALAYETL